MCHQVPDVADGSRANASKLTMMAKNCRTDLLSAVIAVYLSFYNGEGGCAFLEPASFSGR